MATPPDTRGPHNHTRDLFGDITMPLVDNDRDTTGLEQMDDRAFTRYVRKHRQLIDCLADIGLPKPGEQIRLVTRRNFNSIQFLDYIAGHERITDLKMVIYSMNYHAATRLVQLISQGRIERVEILMSNLRNKAHREKEEVMRKLFYQHPRITLWYASSHAKSFSCATAAGNYYTCEGSGNMAYNSRIEQYVIDNDRQMYEFTQQWMAEIKEFLAGSNELEICG